MADIRTTHRDYTILYSENSDKWWCNELDVEDASLMKLKEKIDKLLLKVRKDSAVDVLILNGYSNFSVSEGRAIDAKVSYERQYSSTSGESERLRAISLGIFSYRKGGDRGGKSFFKMGNVALPTPEVHAAIEEARRCHEAVKAAEAKLKAAVDAIPRITEEDVAGLIRAATEKHEV